jgi:hypothetical protein
MTHFRHPLFWLIFLLTVVLLYVVFGWLAVFLFDYFGSTDAAPFPADARLAGQLVAIAAAASLSYFVSKGAVRNGKKSRID